MSIVKVTILTAILCATPYLAFADDRHALSSAPPCGSSGGGLPDPADTQRCLAERYKAPKPKTPPSSAPQPPSTSGNPAGTQQAAP
jgi:hypothetical protein